MCSRYFLDADGNVIAYTFSVPLNERVRRRFNIAPTQEAPVVRIAQDGAREMAMLRWGLVPAWASDIGVGTKMINARGEDELAELATARAEIGFDHDVYRILLSYIAKRRSDVRPLAPAGYEREAA